jgi:hypothetical protein
MLACALLSLRVVAVGADADEAKRMGLELRRAATAAWLPFDDAVMRAVVRTLADTDARET